MKKLVDIINIWYSFACLCVIIAPCVERRESLKLKIRLIKKSEKKNPKQSKDIWLVLE